MLCPMVKVRDWGFRVRILTQPLASLKFLGKEVNLSLFGYEKGENTCIVRTGTCPPALMVFYK